MAGFITPLVLEVGMEWKGGQGEYGRLRDDGVKDCHSVLAILGDLRALLHTSGAHKTSTPDPRIFLFSSSRREGNNGH